MSKVFVLDTNKRPLDPIHPGWARKLLNSGRAAVYRRYPFTIILKKEVVHPPTPALRLKLDPGSKTSWIAIVNDISGEVVWAAELTHRGHAIKERLDARRGVRRGRRHRHTRYRQPRFRNRRRASGWLTPSVESRVTNILTWARRLMRFCALSAISMELVKFDTQAIQNPEIEGAEYQQGTLFGYELREYLLEKWNRQCAYCGKKDVPLQVEHIQCRAHGGSNRCSNLTLACEPCNIKKGTQDIRIFLKDKPDVLMLITAVGRQRRQMCLMNKYGFPRTKAKESRTSHGFQTGDIVKAFVPMGKRAGSYQGKVAIKANGSFSITTRQRTVSDISYRYCQLLHGSDGYSYQKGAPHSSAA